MHGLENGDGHPHPFPLPEGGGGGDTVDGPSPPPLSLRERERVRSLSHRSPARAYFLLPLGEGQPQSRGVHLEEPHRPRAWRPGPEWCSRDLPREGDEPAPAGVPTACRGCRASRPRSETRPVCVRQVLSPCWAAAVQRATHLCARPSARRTRERAGPAPEGDGAAVVGDDGVRGAVEVEGTGTRARRGLGVRASCRPRGQWRRWAARARGPPAAETPVGQAIGWFRLKSRTRSRCRGASIASTKPTDPHRSFATGRGVHRVPAPRVVAASIRGRPRGLPV